MKLHKNHLTEAANYSRTKTGFLFYFKHMFWALHMAVVFIIWAVAMILHAFIPQLFGFTVLQKVVNFIKQMKQEHPDDPILSKIRFDD
jgi:cytochrome b subunit of formate dehydrogenase